MRPTPQDLDAALNHAPVLALIETGDAGDALRVASACIAGGFRCLVIGGEVPDAEDVIGSLAPRPDVIVGLLAPRDEGQVRDSGAAGAAFVLGGTSAEQIGGACVEAGLLWIPAIGAPGDGGSPTGWSLLEGPSGGPDPTLLAAVLALDSSTRVIVSGPIRGDRLGDWVEAGARGVALSGAIYTRELVESGDVVTIRNHAAAVHRAATRCGLQRARWG